MRELDAWSFEAPLKYCLPSNNSLNVTRSEESMLMNIFSGAEERWKEQYQMAHENACQNKDTQEAWKICEALDEECLKRRISLQGIDDDALGEGREGHQKDSHGKRYPRRVVTNGHKNNGCNATNG